MTRIINLRSRKGGVGKTTLALAIAAELLDEGPVILIDADILGTEVAELVPHPGRKEPWDLGLLDLLTASIGANRSFSGWLSDRLGKRPLKSLPRLAIGDEGKKLVVIPSHRSLGPTERDRATAGLGHQMLVLDFAKEQVERRFFSLVSCLLQWNPAAIVIDNSPLHAGLARLTSELPESSPIGLTREHKSLFTGTDPEVAWFNIEVLGPDRPDLLHFFADYKNARENRGSRLLPEAHRGWVLNRHSHFKSSAVGSGCALLAETDKALQTQLLADPEVLHVDISWMLSMSTNARYFEIGEKLLQMKETQQRMAPIEHAAAISRALKTLARTCGDPAGSLIPVSNWRQWLALLESRESP